MKPVLKLAIPNKGRLFDDAVTLLARAGVRMEGSSDRRLFASALDGRLQILFLRAGDIPAFVADDSVHAGITGHDAVAESGHDLRDLLDLGFGGCRLVLAAPAGADILTGRDLPAKARIATSYPRLTSEYFAGLGRTIRTVQVSGAVEVAPTLGVADAVVDLTSSGSTLAMNHLREIDTVLRSTCRLVASPRLQGAAAEELDRLRFALQSVLAARGKRYLLADVPRSTLDEVRSFLPGIAGPTVVEVSGNADVAAIQVVVDVADVYDAVHRLKRLGAEGILVLPVDRMVP